jgi:hypothetical protein
MNHRREILAGLHLLDHQILDRDGWAAGKVDDLELDAGDDPTAALPVVTAILSGAGALSRRLQGRFGRWIESVDERLASDHVPSRIGFELVSTIASHVTVTASHEDLETGRGERWTSERIVGHIPGAGHAPE